MPSQSLHWQDLLLFFFVTKLLCISVLSSVLILKCCESVILCIMMIIMYLYNLLFWAVHEFVKESFCHIAIALFIHFCV